MAANQIRTGAGKGRHTVHDPTGAYRSGRDQGDRDGRRMAVGSALELASVHTCRAGIGQSPGRDIADPPIRPVAPGGARAHPFDRNFVERGHGRKYRGSVDRVFRGAQPARRRRTAAGRRHPDARALAALRHLVAQGCRRRLRADIAEGRGGRGGARRRRHLYGAPRRARSRHQHRDVAPRQQPAAGVVGCGSAAAGGACAGVRRRRPGRCGGAAWCGPFGWPRLAQPRRRPHRPADRTRPPPRPRRGGRAGRRRGGQAARHLDPGAAPAGCWQSRRRRSSACSNRC